MLPQGATRDLVRRGAGAAVLAVKEIDGSSSTDGLLLVRRDSGLRGAEALRGRTICYSDPKSGTGYRLPRAWLASQGLDPDADLVTRFSGSHPQVLVDLLEGACDVGGTHSGNLRTADRLGIPSARLATLGITGQVPHDAVVASPSADPALVAAVRDALLAFDPDEDEVGGISGFAEVPPDYVE